MGMEFHIVDPRESDAMNAITNGPYHTDTAVDSVADLMGSTTEPSQTLANDTVMMFSWGGWEPIRFAMNNLGMLARSSPPPKPDLTVLGWNGPVGYDVLSDPTLPEVAADAIWQWLECEPTASSIPDYKLTNSYWIVTPTEIRSALARLDGKPTPDVPGWDAWIAFLRRAANAGGMQVW